MRTRLHDLLIEKLGDSAHRPAVTFKGTTLDYGSLAESVLRFAGGLNRLPLEPGRRVAVVLEKRIETVVSILATSAAGGVFVPVNPILKSPQVVYVLADCSVSVLVTTKQRWLLLAEHLAELPALEHVVLIDAGDDDPDDPEPEAVTVHRYDDLLRDEPARPAAGVDLDIAAILYTSGSTGRPKGVVLSHRNLIVGAESVSHYLGNTADDVILAALPFSFDAGFSQMTTAFSVGAHVVLMNYLFPGDVVRLCERHGVTGLTCVPPLWIQLAEHGWSPDGGLDAALLREHRRPHAPGDADQAARHLPPGTALPDVRPDRGLPLHLPRSRGGRPAPGLDRQGDPERRDPGRPAGRVALRAGRGG